MPHAIIATVLVFAMSNAGQAGQSGQAGPAGQTGQASAITITGCVERADQLMSGGANTLGTTVDSLDFVLIRAHVAGEQPAATGTSGATAAERGSSERQVAPMYRLDGSAEMLNPHVGHRVEVKGARSEAAPAAGASAAPGGAAAREPPSLATAPLLRVQSVTMVSETCGTR